MPSRGGEMFGMALAFVFVNSSLSPPPSKNKNKNFLVVYFIFYSRTIKRDLIHLNLPKKYPTELKVGYLCKLA